MAVLRVRDKNGNVTEIPAIRGKDGKSAYQSAVEGGYSGTEADFYAALAAAHEHTNKSTLDKFGETDVALTFGGKAVGGSSERPTAQETFLYDDYELVPDASILQSSLTVVSFSEIEKIPEGTEIKTIEFLYNGTWVDIHEMFEIDTVPYSIYMGKVFLSEQNGCYIYGNAAFLLGSVNVIAENITNGAVTATRITYYTD